jgi:RimJ/RimL family protein N-acetyltransferase
MVILETKRLLFRAHEPRDLEAYCAMEQDAEVRRFVGGLPRTPAAAEAKFWATLKQRQDRLGLWATVLKASGCYIGRCGVYPHMLGESAVPNEGVLAFYLARAHWGQGFASEAGRAFVDFAFAELGLKRIVATVESGNVASLRVLERLGFRLIETEVGARTLEHFALAKPAVVLESQG